MKVAQDLSRAPVPVSLNLRYSNGTAARYGARALRYDDTSLRLLSSESFERGTQMKVAAPFLKSIVSCRVSAVSRSPQEPSYFEIDLKFLRPPPFREEAENSDTEVFAAEVAGAAKELARKLEQDSDLSFSTVLRKIALIQRSPLAVASASALLLLLQEKGRLDLARVLEGACKAIPGNSSEKRA